MGASRDIRHWEGRRSCSRALVGRAGNGVAWIHAGGRKSCIDGKRPRMLCSPELRTRLMMERLWRSRVGLPEGNIFLPTKSVSVRLILGL